MSATRSVNWSALAALRFVLAWIVLTGHYDEFAPGGVAGAFSMFGGNAAVVGFLLISGFSIAASIEKRPEGFLFRRLVRIYPMYFGALLLSLAVQRYVVATAVGEPVFPADSWGTILGNFAMVQMFLCKALAYNGPFWSLSIELSFYVLAPFLAHVPRRYLLIPIGLSAIAYTLPEAPNAGLVYVLLTKFNALRYLWAWALGFAIYKNKSTFLSVSGLLLCLVILPQSEKDYISPVTLVTVGTSYLFLLGSHRLTVNASLGRLMNFLGDLSFPLYLVHFPLAVLLAVGLKIQQEAVFYLACFGVSWFGLVVFDGPLKKRVFRPLFNGLFGSGVLRWATRRLPEGCRRNYLV